MELTAEEKKFDRLLFEKRHKEFIESLKGISSEMQKNKKESIDAISKIGKSIEGIIQVIKDIPQPDAPQVNVENDNASVVAAINQMTKSIMAELNDVKLLLAADVTVQEWEFKVNRNNGGYIDSVQVKPKYSKVKAQA